jgi:putative transposase
MGLEPRTTPVQSPQGNGMAEALGRSIKRDYVRVSPLPDARTALESLPLWFKHYNNLHRTRRSVIVPRVSSLPHVNHSDPVQSFGGNNRLCAPKGPWTNSS